MTDKAKWASDVTNAIVGIAEYSAVIHGKGYIRQVAELLEQQKAVLEALLKGV